MSISDRCADSLRNNTSVPLSPSEIISYRIGDAVRVSGLSRSTIYKLIGANNLRSVKVAGRRLIPADALRALIEEAA
jgi:excisionase family DNA binding protein